MEGHVLLVELLLHVASGGLVLSTHAVIQHDPPWAVERLVLEDRCIDAPRVKGRQLL